MKVANETVIVNETTPVTDAVFVEKRSLSVYFLQTLRILLAMFYRDLTVLRRQLVSNVLQILLQPFFFLLIFGVVLPSAGVANGTYTVLLLPGIIAFTVVNTSMQWVGFPLVFDLGYAREIDDRLLAPMHVDLVAIEKIVFAAFRGLIAGVIIFPLSYLILGSGFHIRLDVIWVVAVIMPLAALAAASVGLTAGTIIEPSKSTIAFMLILLPLLFTGCVHYSWSALGSIRWFQIVTLFNPLTYASEGLRSALLPEVQGHTIPTLGIGWSLLGLSATLVIFMTTGCFLFRRRVVK